MRKALPGLLLAALILAPNAALAHPGHEGTAGFLHGFTHPLMGLDHILAMVTVGVFAWQLGGRALWLVPASFVSVMAVAGALGAAGVALPFVEAGIAVSVIALGIMIAFSMQLPVAAAMGVVAFFALFHGYSHGTEISENVSGLAYGASFVVATALLHAMGIGIGIGGLAAQRGEWLIRRGGAGIALVGAALLTGVI